MSENNTSHRMSFTFSCTQKEYYQAYRTMQMRIGFLRYWPLIAGISVLIILCEAQSLLLRDKPLLSAELLVFIALAVIVNATYFIDGFVRMHRRIRHHWHVYQRLGQDKNVNTCSSGLVVTTDAFRTMLPFSDCRVLIERKSYFLLIQNPQFFVVMPKRDIPAASLEDFTKFLRHGFSTRHKTRR